MLHCKYRMQLYRLYSGVPHGELSWYSAMLIAYTAEEMDIDDRFPQLFDRSISAVLQPTAQLNSVLQ